MKPYLVDVPVRVSIWIRPRCQRRQFEVIKQARPSILFISSDGGRNEKEWESIRENRAMYDTEIDWECTVYKIYEEKNNGLYAMGKKAQKLIWDTVDRCIFLEDDIVPSVSYFQYCAELLEKYKDDMRINLICGMNHLGVSPEVTSDYFFARQGSIWGVATWKRTMMQRDTEFNYAKDPYTMKLLEKRIGKNKTFKKRARAYAKQKYYEGHVAGAEFWYEFDMYANNQLQIIPKKNMICNIGCTEEAAHAANLKLMARGARRMFNMETHELSFPLKHNEYVIPDVEYEKKRNRILGYNLPPVLLYRRIEQMLYKLFRGEFKKVFKALKRNRKGAKCLEK